MNVSVKSTGNRSKYVKPSDTPLVILEQRLARQALRLAAEPNLSNLLPDALAILEELATYACLNFSEIEMDGWLNKHPIMQFLIRRMQTVSVDYFRGCNDLLIAMQKMARV